MTIDVTVLDAKTRRAFQRNLKRQHSGWGAFASKSEEELLELAKDEITAKESDLVPSFLVDPKEKARAKKLIKQYVADYSIETSADKTMLKHLIYLEVMHGRLQDQLNQFHTKQHAVPAQLLTQLNKNLESIINARSTLGLTRDKQNKEQSTGISTLNMLKAKFKQWRQDNQASRTMKCPHCSRFILLKIRAHIWEAQHHPFFKDPVLGNPHLIKLYQNGKITEEDVVAVLGTGRDYAQWLMKRWENAQLPKAHVPSTNGTSQ